MFFLIFRFFHAFWGKLVCLNSVNPVFHVFKNMCLRLQYASKYLKCVKKYRFSCRFLVEKTYFVKIVLFLKCLISVGELINL